jgi:hypothetical protein
MSCINSNILAGASGSGSAGFDSPVYVDDLFSTTVYGGTGALQTVETGIDNTGKTLVWIKNRSSSFTHTLCDTVRGAGHYLRSDDTASSSYNLDIFRSFETTGFKVVDYN